MINNQYHKVLWLAIGLLGGCSFDLDLNCSPEERSLQKAAGTGKNDEVKEILEKQTVNLNACCKKHKATPLMRAVERYNKAVVASLLEDTSVDVNKQNSDGDTALIWAVRNGQLDAVKVLLEQKGIKVNLKNNAGDTALATTFENFLVSSNSSADIYSATHGESIRTELLKYKAELRLSDNKSTTIFHQLFAKKKFVESDLELAKMMIKVMKSGDKEVILKHMTPSQTMITTMTRLLRGSKNNTKKLNSNDTASTDKTAGSKPPRTNIFGKPLQTTTSPRKKPKSSRKRAGSAGNVLMTLTRSKRKRNVSSAGNISTLSRKSKKAKESAESASIRQQIIELLNKE